MNLRRKRKCASCFNNSTGVVTENGINNLSLDGLETEDTSSLINRGNLENQKNEKFGFLSRLTTKWKILSWIGVILILLGFAVLTAYLVGEQYFNGGINAIVVMFDFFTEQIIGMNWLQLVFIEMFTLMFGVEFMATIWGQAISYFFYGTIKIFVLMTILVFLISYVQTYFPKERAKRILGSSRGIWANTVGALLGTVTPFCSCSSIPIFMGFQKANISSGVTFSFLISSPLVDIGAFILITSTFGFPIAIIYVVVGIILAVIGGTIIEKTGLGKHINKNFANITEIGDHSLNMPKKERITYAFKEVLKTFKKIWIYVVIGLAIGALIHNVIPESWINAVLGQDQWYSVLIASIVGVPIYADIFGTISIAEALYANGVGAGTILSFMMSVTALSLPSMIMLSKAIKPKLMISFVAIIVIGIIFTGYAFNFIFGLMGNI